MCRYWKWINIRALTGTPLHGGSRHANLSWIIFLEQHAAKCFLPYISLGEARLASSFNTKCQFEFISKPWSGIKTFYAQTLNAKMLNWFLTDLAVTTFFFLANWRWMVCQTITLAKQVIICNSYKAPATCFKSNPANIELRQGNLFSAASSVQTPYTMKPVHLIKRCAVKQTSLPGPFSFCENLKTNQPTYRPHMRKRSLKADRYAAYQRLQR